MRVYSVWLVPQSQDYQRLMKPMRLIADRLNVPVFRPHLTIGSVRTEIDIGSYFDDVSIPPQFPSDIAGEDVFTRSLYLRFPITSELRILRTHLEAHSDVQIGRSFDPHISLCYGLPPDKAAEACEVTELLDQPIVFDRMELTELSLPIETYKDVITWKTVASLPMGQ